nr:hypothetical protein [Francisella tularensis]
MCVFNDPSSKVSIWWEVLAFGVFFSWSESMATAVGLSLITKLVPTKVRGFSTGLSFLPLSDGIELGAYFA